MKITRIEIENVMGIEHLVFEPGTFTLVEGKNGAGKTSTLEAVRSLFRGGEDGTLLRVGADKGAVTANGDDGTVIERRWTRKGETVRSVLDVKIPVGGKVSTPQRVVDSLVDSLGVDPMALLNCPASKRAEYLADIMAIDVPEAAIREAAGRPVAVGKLPAGASGLDRLEAVRKVLYDERTAVNRTAKDKRATAAQLRETLPPESATAAADLLELRAVRAELAEQLSAAEKDAAAKRKAAEKDAATAREKAVEAIKANAQAELDAIREDAQERIRAIERERDSALERVKERAQEQAEAKTAEEKAACAEAERQEREALESARAMLGGAIAEQDTIVALAEAAEKEHARAEKTREILAAAERDAEKAEAESSSLTEGLGRIDALKVSALEKLPIKGLEIREGAVFVDDLPFERVNSARQIEVAFQVAKLRAGKVGLIVADGLERFDEETYRTFEAAAASAGLQFVVGRVGQGELSVRALPAEEGRAA